MAKFFGVIGYGEQVETAPGVHEDLIVEKQYYGDVIRNSRKSEDNGVTVNNDITVGNSISIVSDAYIDEHFFAIRYIKWAGVNWYVSNVDVQPPRLILRLGGVYHGPTA